MTTSSHPLASVGGDAADRFRRLADEWKEKSKHLSNTARMVMPRPYQRIIGMGREALPYIFEELRREPDQWFWALEAITEENPVPAEAAGKVHLMARAWIEWGEHRATAARVEFAGKSFRRVVEVDNIHPNELAEEVPMNVSYSDNIREGAEGVSLLQRATKQMERVLSRSTVPVEVQWASVEDDRGRTLYELKLSDSIGAVSTRFTPGELRSSSDLNYRLLWLHGDLLQNRSHHLLEVLTSGSSSEK